MKFNNKIVPYPCSAKHAHFQAFLKTNVFKMPFFWQTKAKMLNLLLYKTIKNKYSVQSGSCWKSHIFAIFTNDLNDNIYYQNCCQLLFCQSMIHCLLVEWRAGKIDKSSF